MLRPLLACEHTYICLYTACEWKNEVYFIDCKCLIDQQLLIEKQTSNTEAKIPTVHSVITIYKYVQYWYYRELRLCYQKYSRNVGKEIKNPSSS